MKMLDFEPKQPANLIGQIYMATTIDIESLPYIHKQSSFFIICEINVILIHNLRDNLSVMLIV